MTHSDNISTQNYRQSSCIPAHKQTDPNKLPGQVVNDIDVTLSDYIKRLEGAYNKDTPSVFDKWWMYAKDRYSTVTRCDAFSIWEEAQASLRGQGKPL